jgi:large subunit ribosomal protein L9
MMELILTQDVQGLGKAQQIVKVNDGYARNFLLPQGLGLVATQKNLKALAQLQQRKSQQLEKEKQLALGLANKLKSTSINVAVTTNEEDKLYGSVSQVDIASALKEEGYDIPEENILLNEPIRSLGIYDVPVKLHPEVQAKIKLWIVKK